MIGVRSVEKRFGSFAALRDVSLEVASGELVALLGPSGSGKTTLLRILAGLEAPDAGSVFLEDADCTSAPAAERRVGFVFQHYALFRHMTVFENVAFGLRVLPRKLRPDKREIERRVKRLLALVRLEGHAEHPPSALSGGQRQRIALARALAIEPRVLLLDEPFGALDARVREELRSWLRRLHDEIRVTTILVTHDQEEAMAVSDRVVVMNEGRIEQIGTPEELERAPSSRFVFEFVGHANVLELPGDTTALGYVRPHDLELSRVTGPGATVEVLVRRVRTSGAVARIELAQSDAGAPALVAEIARERLEALDLRVGERLFAGARRTRVFPKESP